MSVYSWILFWLWLCTSFSSVGLHSYPPGTCSSLPLYNAMLGCQIALLWHSVCCGWHNVIMQLRDTAESILWGSCGEINDSEWLQYSCPFWERDSILGGLELIYSPRLTSINLFCQYSSLGVCALCIPFVWLYEWEPCVEITSWSNNILTIQSPILIGRTSSKGCVYRTSLEMFALASTATDWLSMFSCFLQ